MTIYSVLCSIAEMHTKIIGGGYTDLLQFDLTNKTIKSGDKFIVHNGKVVQDFLEFTDGSITVLADVPLVDERDYEDPYEKVKELYKKYRKSVPSVQSAKRKSNFKALTSDDLTFDEMLAGENRIKASYELEAFILLGVASGHFAWENPNHWFWKSKDVPGLVLYKKWF